jgi:hypothetical protein
VLTNLIPTAFAGHALYRIGQAWFYAEYLPAAFYAMATALLLVSLLPGYLLLALRMRRACAALDPRQPWSIASSIRWPPRRCGRCASG